MVRSRVASIAAGLLLLAIPVAAGLIDDTRRTLKTALSDGNYIGTANALKDTIKLRSGATDKEFEPLFRAVTRGLKHKDDSIAIVCVRAVGELKYPNSSRYLSPLLKVPKRPKRWQLHLAAIETTGVLHELPAVPKLEQLLAHDKTDFAVAAAKALAGYAAMQRPQRIDLVKRLANTLGRLEKKKPKTRSARIRLSVVKTHLIESVNKVAGTKGLQSAKDAREWVQSQKKPPSKG